jgi:putative membrane protein
VVRKYYGKLIKLPRSRTLFAIISIEFIAVLLRSLQVGILTFAALVVYMAASTAIFKSHFKVALFFGIGASFLYFIFTFLPIPYTYALGILSPLMTFSLIPYRREILAVLLGITPALLGALVFMRDLPYVLFYLFLVGAVTYLYSKALNGKGMRAIGIPSLKVARPFIASFTDGRVNLVEDFLRGVGTNMDLQVVLFKFQGNSTHYWVLPKIHFGLFGSVGSSKFVYQVEQELPNSTVFHGPGSHEIDMVSSSDAASIARRVKEEASSGWTQLTFTGLLKERAGEFEALSLTFDGAKLSFLTRPGLGIDDLPLSLWNSMLSSNSFLVDSHNSSLSQDIGEEDVASLSKIFTHITGQPGNLLMGYGEGIVDGEARGLCNRRVKAFSLSDGTKRFVIVYLYGNNADKDLQAKLRSENSDLADDLLLVTPDDHSCTGVSVESLYYPVSYSPSLSKAVREATELSLKNIEPVQVSVKIFTVKGVRVIGKIISALTKGLEEVGAFTTRTIWIPIASPLGLMALTLLIQSSIELGVHLV